MMTLCCVVWVFVVRGRNAHSSTGYLWILSVYSIFWLFKMFYSSNACWNKQYYLHNFTVKSTYFCQQYSREEAAQTVCLNVLFHYNHIFVEERVFRVRYEFYFMRHNCTQSFQRYRFFKSIIMWKSQWLEVYFGAIYIDEVCITSKKCLELIYYFRNISEHLNYHRISIINNIII